jgi:quercetin dioxygenase-like cupin family protein
MKMQLAIVILAALLVPAIAQQDSLKRKPLASSEFPPGYQTIMGMGETGPNTCSGRVTHPGVENAYILEGDLTLRIDGQPDRQLKAGDSFQVPAGVVHDACTRNGVKAFGVNVIEKGKPLVSPAP